MSLFGGLFGKRETVAKIDVRKRFDLLARMGQGSMSKVWRARDKKTNRVVALKVLDKEKTEKLEARFKGLKKPLEGEIAIKLVHPNIVRTYEFGWTTQGEQFLVMEFVEGLTLSFLVDMQNNVMRERRLQIMIQLGESIDYFHKNNWIHRDICPRNILLDHEYQVKLIDFGLVVPNTPEFQAPGNRTGTANYMAPELIRRQRTDQRIDVFSYAVTCYEMYTKQYPWKAGETLEMVVRHINAPPTDIRELVPDIEPQAAQAIMKGLEKLPDDRWPSVLDMVKEFREAERRRQKTRAEKRVSPGQA